MIRARTYVAWLLLALWPLAMLHCDVEATGVDWPLLVHHEHDYADGHGHSNEFPAAAVHPSDDLGLQGAGIKVRGPELWLFDEWAPVELRSHELQATSPPPQPAAPVAWIKTWHFERRAAWPARAPSVCA